MSRLARILLAFATSVELCGAGARVYADRVGYTFGGSLDPYRGRIVQLFGVTDLAPGADISGSFSYETTTPATGTSPSKYYQSIDSGFALSIDDGRLQITAHDYDIAVTNDFHRQYPPEIVDTVDVVFSSHDTKLHLPLIVNGKPWISTDYNYIILELTYPSETFSDSSLPVNLPNTFYPTTYSIFGDNNVENSPFKITTITPIPALAGDYNVDDALTGSDYMEWRNVFGASDQLSRYADGNDNGVVDAADYVVWRKAQAVAGNSAVQAATVPEPASLGWLATLSLAAGIGSRFTMVRSRTKTGRSDAAG
jgi:hypothetical protein